MWFQCFPVLIISTNTSKKGFFANLVDRNTKTSGEEKDWGLLLIKYINIPFCGALDNFGVIRRWVWVYVCLSAAFNFMTFRYTWELSSGWKWLERLSYGRMSYFSPCLVSVKCSCLINQSPPRCCLVFYLPFLLLYCLGSFQPFP